MRSITGILHQVFGPNQVSWLILIWMMVGSPLQILGQEIPAIITYDRDAYNGGNKNWGFAEDDEGNLYVANTEGILIFNGMNWQKVILPRHRVPRSIYRGYDGRIYAGGYETIGYIDRSDPGKPVFVEIGQDLLQGTEEEIWHITGSADQILFQSFSLILFKDSSGLELYKPHVNIMFGQWIDNRLYIPQIENGLYIFDNGNERMVNPSTIPDHAVISGLETFGNGRVLIATRNHGLFILEDSTASPIQGDLNEQLKTYQINDLIALKNGDYALGTIQNGVYITDKNLRIRFHINKSNGLANNSVLSLYETRAGALCIGLNIGMNILMVHKPDLYYYDVEGILGTVFASMFFRENFYVGTNQGVFVQNEQGRFSLVPGSQGQVWCLYMAGENLLCGHNSGTLQWIDGEFVMVSSITGGIHMQLLNESQLLQSTYNGLILLEKRDGLWQDTRRILGTDKLVDRFVYHAGEVVGLHPYFGLVYYKLDLPQYRMTYRKIFQNLEISIGNNNLGLLSLQNKILVRVDTLLYRVDNYGSLVKVPSITLQKIKQENKYLEYQILKPLNNNSEQNRLISYYPKKELAIRTIEEGYAKHFTGPPEFQNGSAGLSLEYVWVNNELSDSSQGELNLYPNENNLTVQLSPVNGFLQEIAKPEYKLTSYDDTWNSIPENGRLDFKQLNHGSYILEIRHGDEMEYALLTFTIFPHWYESWPGAILYLFIAGILAWYINQRNKKRLKLEKEKMLQEKEAALAAERIKARTEQLEHEVAFKSKMLANSAMTMVQKNKMLNELKEVIKTESSQSDSVQTVKGKAIKLIDRNLNSDESWEIFDRNFAEVHEDFIERFKTVYPGITPGDLRLAAYIRMNLSSKEIAPILQISVRSVENKRYRLRKKINLSSDANLSEYLMRF